MRRALLGCSAAAALFLDCGGVASGLNQSPVACPRGRTSLDGVCVAESVADYVGCVRAQGVQLGGTKGEKMSAEAGTLGVRASGSAELNESLEKKYSVSPGAELEIIHACNRQGMAASAAPCTSTKQFSGFSQFYKCHGDGDVLSLGDRGAKEDCLDACKREPKAAGCWYLDGSGGYPRDCRVCVTMQPVKDSFANDWAGGLTAGDCRAP